MIEIWLWKKMIVDVIGDCVSLLFEFVGTVTIILTKTKLAISDEPQTPGLKVSA